MSASNGGNDELGRALKNELAEVRSSLDDLGRLLASPDSETPTAARARVLVRLAEINKQFGKLQTQLKKGGGKRGGGS